MKSRAINYIAATLCLALLSTTTLAGPIQINRVQQVIKGSSATGWQDSSSELRTNDPPKTNDPVKAGNNDPTKNVTTEPQKQEPQTPVRTETIEEFIEAGECNCPQPDPIVAKTTRGFPWWVLGGGAVPLAFIDRKKSNPPPDDNPPSSPTPTPPTTPEPEPLTLLLFGSGLLALGAGARRKFAAANVSEDNQQ